MGTSEHQQPETANLQYWRDEIKKEGGEGLTLLADIENNPVCSLSIDEKLPCVYVIWKRYATSAQIRFIHESIIQLLKKYNLSKILGDDTALPTIHAEDQAWIVQDWLPRAVAAGLRATANKSPESYFARISIHTIQSVLPQNMQFQSFSTLADAREWLVGT